MTTETIHPALPHTLKNHLAIQLQDIENNLVETRLFLPDGFLFKDYHNYSPIVQSAAQFSLNGALIVQQGRKLAGREIELSGEQNWLDEATLQALMRFVDLSAEGAPLYLNYMDLRLQVMFNHQEQAIDAEPVKYMPSAGTTLAKFYRVTIRLIQTGN